MHKIFVDWISFWIWMNFRMYLKANKWISEYIRHGGRVRMFLNQNILVENYLNIWIYLNVRYAMLHVYKVEQCLRFVRITAITGKKHTFLGCRTRSLWGSQLVEHDSFWGLQYTLLDWSDCQGHNQQRHIELHCIEMHCRYLSLKIGLFCK